MSMLKYDPKQSKTVAVLLTILIIAIIAIVVRMKHAAAPAQTAQTAQSNAIVAGVDQTASIKYISNRNPFERSPFVVTDSHGIRDRLASDADMIGKQNSIFSKQMLNKPLPPMHIEVRPKNSVKPKVDLPAVSMETKPIPSFILLATVKGKDGLCAIIKTDDSETKIVQIGDSLKEGFKLQSVDELHAILTDGRNVIIAKRPQS